MRCPSCAGLIEESDVQFCPFCGMQIRVSSAGKPTTPLFNPSFPGETASYAPGGYETSALPISTAAAVSLVFGILGRFTAPVICSIIAIVAGHRARREIAASNGRLGGSGRARAGITMGYIQLALSAFLCILAFVTLLAVGMAGPR